MQRNQRSICQHPLGSSKATEFQKNIYFCFIDYAKTFDCVDHNKLWKIHKEMGILDHLTSLLSNLYAGQEATVRTGQGPIDWFQIGKRVHQGYILSPCLFNLNAAYIMQSVRLKWSEAAQSCPSLCNPMDCSLPGSSVLGIFQATVLEWIAISFSRGSSQPRDQTRVSRIVDRRFTVWATREVQMSDWMYANWNQDCWEKHQ